MGTTAQPGQLEKFVLRTSHVAPPEDHDQRTGERAARVPFPSALELTGEQEEIFVDHALSRLQQMEQETGRDIAINQRWFSNERITADPTANNQATKSWMMRRARYTDVFENNLDWRPFIFGGIFTESNLVVPLARRIARQMIARAQNYFFGTEPWFSCDPEPDQKVDRQLADRINRYSRWKLNRLGSKRNKERGIHAAMVRGECAVKTTHVTRDTLFETNANVLIDTDDQPILDQDGDYILDTDAWQAPTAVDPATGQPAPVSGPEVLTRDGVTAKPSTLIWKQMKIPRHLVTFKGAEAAPIFFKDFLCPLTAPDVQTADAIAHLYDKPVADLVNLFVKRGLLEASAAGEVEAVKKAIQLIRDLTSNTSLPKAGANQPDRPNDDLNSARGHVPTGEPIAEVAEMYLWFDPFGDGILRNIMLVVDRKNRVPIFYDYVGNVTPDGLRPIDIVRINEVEGRWYGIGVMEMFESTQNIVDLLVNRWNHGQSRAGRVDFWRPDLTKEGESNPDLKMNWGGTYTAKPNVKPEDILHSVYLEDSKFENLERMFEFFMQIAQNESGVGTTNDAQTAGLETSKLATGIRNIERAGQELFAPFLSDLEPGLTAILEREILTLFANLDGHEIFQYFEGNTARLDTITPEEVRNIAVKVTMLLTRYKGEQLLVQGQQAAAIVQQFYMLPVQIQPFVADFFKQQLKAIDQKYDADTIIQPGIAQMPVSPGSTPPSPATAAAATQPLNPGKSPANL